MFSALQPVTTCGAKSIVAETSRIKVGGSLWIGLENVLVMVMLTLQSWSKENKQGNVEGRKPGGGNEAREGTSRWEAKGNWGEEKKGARSTDGREKSAMCITLMKYDDSLTVRLSSSSRLSLDSTVSSRQGKVLLWLLLSSACHGGKSALIWTWPWFWMAWNGL